MARLVRDAAMETRSARLRLGVRDEPYWRTIEIGLHLGYRKRKAGGTWTARLRKTAGGYKEKRLGLADDTQDADGVAVLSYPDAQAAARSWWVADRRRAKGFSEAPSTGPYLISDSLEEYFASRTRKGSKGVSADQAYARTRIIPKLGALDVESLNATNLRKWHEDLAGSARLSRRSYSDKRPSQSLDRSNKDAVRARKASANRVLTILKAALNHSYQEGRASSDDAWRKVKPFKSVDKPVVRYLSLEEISRLIRACPKDFGNIVKVALASGCRYGELTCMKVQDFCPQSGTLVIAESKGGKPRHAILTSEGQELLARLTRNRRASEPLLVRADGLPWGASHQQRPIKAASIKASIDPPATFHILRHSHASFLAMRGVPMAVIAKQLGHSDTRMTERHYAHLAPTYVSETIRNYFPTLGLS